ASYDRTARVWDAITGEPVTPPLKHRAEVVRALFSPDGHRLLTSTSDGLIQIWEIQRDTRPVEDDLLLARLVSGHQIEDTGAPAPVTTEALQAAWQTLRPKYAGEFNTSPQQLVAWNRH